MKVSNTRLPRGLRQPEAGVLERRGSRVHYWFHGPEDAPLVAFTHGAGMDHQMFDAQVAVLTDYRVLTWDIPGHGLSQPLGDDFSIRNAAFDLIAILELHGVREAVFIGQSLGGYVVQELVFSKPERVRALGVIGSTCITFKLTWFDKVALYASVPAFRYWPRKQLWQAFARATAVKPGVQAYASSALEQVSQKDFAVIWRAVVDCLHYEPSYRIQKPLLITHGDHDDTGNIKKDAPKWYARDPLSDYVVIPEAGHNANQDNPPFFNEVLHEFLDKL